MLLVSESVPEMTIRVSSWGSGFITPTGLVCNEELVWEDRVTCDLAGDRRVEDTGVDSRPSRVEICAGSGSRPAGSAWGEWGRNLRRSRQPWVLATSEIRHHAGHPAGSQEVASEGYLNNNREGTTDSQLQLQTHVHQGMVSRVIRTLSQQGLVDSSGWINHKSLFRLARRR